MPLNKDDLISSIADTISDYRIDEREAGNFMIPEPNSEHVECWINQFDEQHKLPILEEMNYILDRTYIPKSTVDSFLRGFARNNTLTGDNPELYWSTVNLLNIQQRGRSQELMVSQFKDILFDEFNISYDGTGTSNSVFFYFDDIAFSGGHVKNDLELWITNEAPNSAHVNICLIACHKYGQWRNNKELLRIARALGKNITFSWWRIAMVEDRLTYINLSDVLRPVGLPANDMVQEYYEEISENGTVYFRIPGSTGRLAFFSCEEKRSLIEQVFLVKGVEIRSNCHNLNEFQRPLGNHLFKSFGFGSMLVTYRNCPNNCPLVFWVGDPWYPLFPRYTNR